VARWVPQAQTMARATVAVTHGGSGSTLAALATGVPSVALPLFADGGDNARRVAARGAGIALEGGLEALPRLREAVLAAPRHGAAARAIAGELRALPPIDDAVALLARAEALGAHA
jgi:UDP:flavonoid glycosyltransferase YjiC (YdhE family)